MKFKTAITILLAFAATGFAQDRMADTLRKGILEEESRHDLGKAVQQYYTVLRQFSEVRQTAATALFRMAECFRKQGNRPQAIESYQRILNEFADQTKLAAQSRTILATTYKSKWVPGILIDGGSDTDKAKFDQLMSVQKQELTKANEARLRYRHTIEDEMALISKQIDEIPFGKRSAEWTKQSNELNLQLIHLKRDLAAFDAGLTAPSAR